MITKTEAVGPSIKPGQHKLFIMTFNTLVLDLKGLKAKLHTLNIPVLQM